MKGSQLKKCRLCEQGYTILARSCPHCGYDNEQFFNMPVESREAYVEFFHDKEVFVSMEAQAIRENIDVAELYKKAAEAYLDSLVRKTR